jgi:hypothetical protein
LGLAVRTSGRGLFGLRERFGEGRADIIGWLLCGSAVLKV